MTDTTQGGLTKSALAATTKDTPEVDRDPQTGINKDMPADEGEAAGNPRGLTFGGPIHK